MAIYQKRLVLPRVGEPQGHSSEGNYRQHDPTALIDRAEIDRRKYQRQAEQKENNTAQTRRGFADLDSLKPRLNLALTFEYFHSTIVDLPTCFVAKAKNHRTTPCR